MKLKWFKTMMDHLSEGVVMMDKERTIKYINNLGLEMTGWKVGGRVPYCSYCQLREVKNGEERCLLVQEDPLPVFQAHMPTYKGLKESFQMSTSSIDIEGERMVLLILRNPKWTFEEHDHKVRELLMQETMIAQEAERKRIAMELHDHIGQSVFSVFLGLQGFKQYLYDDRHKQHLYKMEKLLHDTIEDLKILTKDLCPSILDHLGIEKALRSAIKDWMENYEIEIEGDFIDITDDTLSREKSLQLFRVIQESVHNAVRHGKATRVKIFLQNEKRKLYFKVVDNGNGFDIEEARERGVGLYHMIERIEMVGGEIKWFSCMGGPTRVEGYIPID